MSFHLVGWYEASITADADADIQPVPDQIMLIQNNHFVPQREKRLNFAMVQSLDPVHAYFASPKLRQLSNPYIRPLYSLTTTPEAKPIADYRENPLAFAALEELALYGQHSEAGGTTVAGVAGLTEGALLPAPAGDIITMRGTSTTAAVAGAWTSISVTWPDTLPVGRYSVVGLSYIAANAIAARLILEDQVERPGAPGIEAAADIEWPGQRLGGLGDWGSFSANRFPNVEVLSGSTDAVHTVFLDFVRTG